MEGEDILFLKVNHGDDICLIGSSFFWQLFKFPWLSPLGSGIFSNGFWSFPDKPKLP